MDPLSCRVIGEEIGMPPLPKFLVGGRHRQTCSRLPVSSGGTLKRPSALLSVHDGTENPEQQTLNARLVGILEAPGSH